MKTKKNNVLILGAVEVLNKIKARYKDNPVFPKKMEEARKQAGLLLPISKNCNQKLASRFGALP